MSRDISVHFLGTTSGGGPTETRNCSSLVVDSFGGSGQLWSAYPPLVLTSALAFASAVNGVKGFLIGLTFLLCSTVVDCAEGTVRQFEKQPSRPGQQRLRVGQVSKIFITHMHGE